MKMIATLMLLLSAFALSAKQIVVNDIQMVNSWNCRTFETPTQVKLLLDQHYHIDNVSVATACTSGGSIVYVITTYVLSAPPPVETK